MNRKPWADSIREDVVGFLTEKGYENTSEVFTQEKTDSDLFTFFWCEVCHNKLPVLDYWQFTRFHSLYFAIAKWLLIPTVSQGRRSVSLALHFSLAKIRSHTFITHLSE